MSKGRFREKGGGCYCSDNVAFPSAWLFSGGHGEDAYVNDSVQFQAAAEMFRCCREGKSTTAELAITSSDQADVPQMNRSLLFLNKVG